MIERLWGSWVSKGYLLSWSIVGVLAPTCEWPGTEGVQPNATPPDDPAASIADDEGVCSSHCPLRVDTHLPVGGDGSDWETALNDLQLAIDIQAQAGGGEVWLRGGTINPEQFIGGQLELANDVAVLGGFEGFERSASERRPEAEPSAFPGVRGYDGVEIPLFIAGAHSVWLDNFQLGDASLRILGSEDVLLTRITFGFANPLLIAEDSSLRFEHSFGTPHTLHDGYRAILFDRSRVAFVDSGIRYFDGGDVVLTDSMVSLERFDGSVEWILDDASKLLAVDSTLENNYVSEGIVTGGDVALVGSRLTGGSSGKSAVHVKRVIAYNSSFVFNSAGPERGAWPRASVLYGQKSVEVSFCTFFGNHCSWNETYFYADIFAADHINNSVFVPHREADPAVDPKFFAVMGPLDASNCATHERERFTGDWQSRDAFAHSHPCPNIGDAHEGAASLVRLKRFTPPFLQPPFNVDISRYDSPEWWRNSSSTSEGCRDEGAPDPGHHRDFACAE